MAASNTRLEIARRSVGASGSASAACQTTRTPQSGHPARRLDPSPTRHRRPRFATKPAAEPRGPTPSQRAARKSFAYRPPLPGAREHRPLRTVRDSGLPRGHPASAPQLASKRPRRNGSGGGARGAGSVRVRRRRKRAWAVAPRGGAGPPLPRGAERPVAWEIRDAQPPAPPPDASGSAPAAFEYFGELASCVPF